MTQFVVKVSDSALMYLCLIGLESYCVPRVPKETYGLLWGAITHKRNERAHYQVDHVSTDVEAERTSNWVSYSKRSLGLKKQIIEECWPSLAFLGDFHTHPYRNREEAMGGYQLSEDDRKDVEEINRTFWLNAGLKISLIMSIHPLGRQGWQNPGRVNDKSHTAKWTLRNYSRRDYYRLRLSAYVVSKIRDGRRYSLALSPREHGWDNSWMTERQVSDPQHTVRLDVPSVMGNPNFTGELNA